MYVGHYILLEKYGPDRNFNKKGKRNGHTSVRFFLLKADMTIIFTKTVNLYGSKLIEADINKATINANCPALVQHLRPAQILEDN